MMISGDNFQNGIQRGDGDYYFSKIPHTWGWATWRRAWKEFDFDMKDFPDFLKNKLIEEIWDDKKIQKYWLERFGDVYTKRLDAWDYQFAYAIWKNNGICISPNVNLVSNIGFGAGASNTFNNSDALANIPAKSIRLPLTHPKEMVVNKTADDRDNHTRMKYESIKRFFKQIGLFNYVRNIYREYL
ncbi:MAG TPA: hypothetical protein VMR99_02085 [Candidatus Paceibacterota bacterium]|nr:hypothetical protein [Candidatus Paceibacterota bacterium]